MQGGELVLQQRDLRKRSGRANRPLAQIQPQTNILVHFRGNLTHSVNKVTSSEARISLVCEQYSLNPNQLQKIPEFQIQSKARRNLS